VTEPSTATLSLSSCPTSTFSSPTNSHQYFSQPSSASTSSSSSTSTSISPSSFTSLSLWSSVSYVDHLSSHLLSYLSSRLLWAWASLVKSWGLDAAWVASDLLVCGIKIVLRVAVPLVASYILRLVR
jgi:hypothetical protein